MNKLQELRKAGQSPWYDNIARGLLTGGGLKHLVEQGILGVTSNPTIFEKSINGSADYDVEIQRLAQQGMAAKEIYDELTVADVSMAADILSDVYKESKGLDGYVSIEVWPEYATSADRTIDYARKIFSRINKPNIMIKVPGTAESPAAIETLIAEGINVNVTLLFSIEQYDRIAQAYLAGLNRRLRNKADISGVRSVASVFVSRIDTYVDKMLEEKKNTDLKGRAAIANSKLLYQQFLKILGSAEFKALAKKGAHPQRVLWASTSTKNPLYSDVIYVNNLIGPDTINTLPAPTVEAFLDHGKVSPTLTQDLGSARGIVRELGRLGIDISGVCETIQRDGLKAFQDSFDTLIQSIQRKTAAPARV